MKLKICGITQETTLIGLNEQQLWPDYIGFVFAKSRRKVLTEQVLNWLQYIPQDVKTVGVYVNPSIDELVKGPVDIIQLHGDETPYYCQLIKDVTGKEVWKSFLVQQGQGLNIDEYSLVVDGFIFDAPGPNRGGNGKKFNWDEHIDRWKQIENKVFIAGGITKADTATLKRFPIDGIDLSSGVEIDGVKSVERIIEMIQEVRR